MKKNAIIILACIAVLAGGIYFSITQLNIMSVFASISHYGKSEIKDDGKEFNMVALGDSLSYGVGNSGNSGYVGHVEKKLEKRMKAEVSVEDYGVPDDTSQDLLKRLKNEQVRDAISEAKVVYLNIGMNDYLNSLMLAKTKPPKQKMQIIQNAQTKYQRNLKQALLTIRKSSPEAYVYLVGIYNPFPNENERLSDTELIHQWNTKAAQITNQEKKIKFINVENVFVGKNKKAYFADNLHPNKKGYQLIGNKVFKSLELS